MFVTIAAVTLYTIGHGTRPLESFLETLRRPRIELLADVRSFPGSRANPQYNKEALERTLPSAGIAYEHWAALGGRRRGLGAASPNTAWEHPAFRGYADYMMEDTFWQSLDALLARTTRCATVIMCSERLWWRCHRRMIADAATARGVRVLHLMKAGEAVEHVLAPVARIVGDRVVYTAVG